LKKTKKDLELKIKDLEVKVKEFETKAKDLQKNNEKMTKDYELKAREYEQKLKEAEDKYKDLEKRKKEGDSKINRLQSQNEEGKEQLEWLRKEHQKLISSTERVEGEASEEVSKLQQKIETLESEKQVLQDKAIEAEHSKTDMENKLIQERLRHHQTVVDMQKVNETLKQAEKNLDDEMEAHRKSLDKIEIYKTKIVESDKKRVDYKKTIKKLSQQILELHSKLNDMNKKDQSSSQNQDEAKEDYSTEVLQDVKFTDRDLVTSPTESRGDWNSSSLDTQTIKQLQIQLEDSQHEITNLKALISKLTTENQSILSQNKVLQEKREIGLQEIQKLSQSLEKLKVQYPDLDFSMISQSVIPKEVSERIQPSSALSMHRANSSTSSALGQNDSSPLSTLQRQSSLLSSQPGKSNLANIKKHLDQLYKEVIMALTNETITSIKQKSHESQGLTAELELEQHLVKIEKKVNDVILLLNDYSELITKFFKKASEFN